MSEAISAVDYSTSSSNQTMYLQNRLQEVEDEQGIFGKAWNGLKEMTDFGVSLEKCESMLEQYQNGEVSFDEAVEYIDSFEQKQENTTELAKNVATGAATIALATATCGTSLGWSTAAAIGVPAGAAFKTALGAADRATNDIEGDTFDTKEITKDAVSGAVTGMTSAVSSGVGKGIESGNILTSVKNGTACGLASGAIAGSTSYLTDVALEEDKEFNFGDLTMAAASSALVSGAVGGTVGAGMYGCASINNTIGTEIAEESLGTIIAQDSAASSARKILSNEVKTAASIAV